MRMSGALLGALALATASMPSGNNAEVLPSPSRSRAVRPPRERYARVHHERYFERYLFRYACTNSMKLGKKANSLKKRGR